MSIKELARKEEINNLAVEYRGDKIVLPVVNNSPMSFDEAIEWMKRKKVEDEQEVSFHYEIACSPLDGLHAFHQALAEKYGWVASVPTPGFFGSNPPKMLGIRTGVDTVVNAPYGRVIIPGIDGYIDTQINLNNKPSFILRGEVRKKHSENVKEISLLTEKYLKENSIYQGKAIKISFDYLNEDNNGDLKRGYDPMQDAPSFLDIANVKEDDLIFGEKVNSALRTGLFTPIEQSDACREHHVPLKRGVLLYGVYGTGKSMTAYTTAAKATRNGWTFIYLDNVVHLQKGLEFAKHYAPAVIFAEDIDRAVHGERSVSMDEILNTLDGIDTKDGEVITVLTTNHVEQINPAMLRPGRLDTLIEVTPPDAKAAEKLVSLYARGLLAADVDLTAVGERLQGNIPAFIREVTERAKISAIGRLNGGDIKGKVLGEDIIDAASAMENHMDMLKPKDDADRKGPELLVKIPAGHSESKVKALLRDCA